MLNQLGDALPFFNASTATTATARGYVDAKNFGDIDIVLSAAVASATNSSATFTSLAIQHSDTTDASNFSTILEGTSGTPTSSQFALTVNNTVTAYTAYRASVKTDGRKRYVGVLFQPMTAYNTNFAVAFKSNPTEGPSATGGCLAHGVI